MTVEIGCLLAGGDAEGKMEVETSAAAAGPVESMVVEEDENCFATYQLTGVLTHKGDSADGGHYVAWIRKDDGTWYLFDDEKVRSYVASSVYIPLRACSQTCSTEDFGWS